MREYFYTIDSKGRIFHEGSELTDRDFLDFFLKRLQPNLTESYPEYPYLSLCGKERNFVQTEHYPIVFRRMEENRLYYGPSLFSEFRPEDLRFDAAGNLNHPGENGIRGRISEEILVDPLWNWKTSGEEEWILLWNGREYPVHAD